MIVIKMAKTVDIVKIDGRTRDTIKTCATYDELWKWCRFFMPKEFTVYLDSGLYETPVQIAEALRMIHTQGYTTHLNSGLSSHSIDCSKAQ